ncbi:hypothetical protein, partial [Salmonella enterica]
EKSYLAIVALREALGHSGGEGVHLEAVGEVRGVSRGNAEVLMLPALLRSNLPNDRSAASHH